MIYLFPLLLVGIVTISIPICKIKKINSTKWWCVAPVAKLLLGLEWDGVLNEAYEIHHCFFDIFHMIWYSHGFPYAYSVPSKIWNKSFQWFCLSLNVLLHQIHIQTAHCHSYKPHAQMVDKLHSSVTHQFVTHDKIAIFSSFCPHVSSIISTLLSYYLIMSLSMTSHNTSTHLQFKNFFGISFYSHNLK